MGQLPLQVEILDTYPLAQQQDVLLYKTIQQEGGVCLQAREWPHQDTIYGHLDIGLLSLNYEKKSFVV
jgi:hypothetical protein